MPTHNNPKKILQFCFCNRCTVSLYCTARWQGIIL